MKLALEALENHSGNYKLSKAECVKYRAVEEALRQAIEQAQNYPPECQTEAEKTAFAFGWWKALEANREQAQKQEPVAWITQGGKGWLRWHKSYDDNKDSVPLYTSPPQRQPLTPESVFQIADQHPVEGFGPDIMAFARAIEAAHGIKGEA